MYNMADVILTFDTAREQAIHTAYNDAVNAYKDALIDDAFTAESRAPLLAAAVVAAYPDFIKLIKFKVGSDFYKGIIFLNKFLVADGLSTEGLKDISTQLTAYTSATSIAEGKTSHDALVVYLDSPAYFVQEIVRVGGFKVASYTSSTNDDRDRVSQITACEEINDGSSSILTAPTDAASEAAPDSDSEVVAA
jgi:hypothetical protein